MGSPARSAICAVMRYSSGASASVTGWALCMRSTMRSLPHQAHKLVAAAMASATSAPCCPPTSQPAPTNTAPSPASSTIVFA